ncbi:hypothetical protein CEXT_354771 [Caerostris extrusa]|uniref:Uncharacterized protein n=1 Tax=Caerostris extrusa TaxID=172846 RepID=A0AAV4S6E5_CAEEX|nr:hypothetical protein CEXT_354771 [Caerostris extrusa]
MYVDITNKYKKLKINKFYFNLGRGKKKIKTSYLPYLVPLRKNIQKVKLTTDKIGQISELTTCRKCIPCILPTPHPFPKWSDKKRGIRIKQKHETKPTILTLPGTPHTYFSSLKRDLRVLKPVSEQTLLALLFAVHLLFAVPVKWPRLPVGVLTSAARFVTLNCCFWLEGDDRFRFSFLFHLFDFVSSPPKNPLPPSPCRRNY